MGMLGTLKLRTQGRVGAGVLLAMALSAAALGQDAAPRRPRETSELSRPFFQLYVDTTTFAAICGLLELNEAQRLVAQAVFEQYTADITKMSAAARQAVNDAGARRVGELSREAKGDWSAESWDEVDALYHQYHPVRVEWLKRSDRRLDRFYVELTDVLYDHQKEAFSAVPRFVRRVYYERKYPPGQVGGRYAQLVTLRSLLTIASEQLSEVAWVMAEDNEGALSPGMSEARQAIEQILHHYDVAYDQLTIDEIKHLRRKLEPGESMRFSSTSPRGQRLIKRGVKQYILRHDAIMQIGNILGEATGDAVRQGWIDLYYRHRNPELFRERWPDRMVDWVAQQPDASDGQIEAARQLAADYELRRDAIRRAVLMAVDHTIRQLVFSDGETRALLRQERLKMQLRQLIERNFEALRTLLTPSQTRALDEEQKEATHTPYLLGPPIDPRVNEDLH